MSAFELNLQQAIYNALNAAALGVPIYDDVPQRSEFPYIVIGEDSHADWSVDDNVGTQASVTIHVWDRTRGRKKIKTLQGAIYDALNRATLTAAGYNFVTIDLLTSESFLDADGKTRHGVQVFNVMIEEA